MRNPLRAAIHVSYEVIKSMLGTEKTPSGQSPPTVVPLNVYLFPFSKPTIAVNKSP